MGVSMRLLAAAAALAYGGAAVASSQEWRVDPAASSLEIVYLIDGKAWRGAFGVFDGAGRFDPARPEDATMTLEIDTASIDVGNIFGTAVAKTADWLDVVDHPKAIYELTRLSPIGEGRYLAEGVLTMRGASHAVVGEISLDIGDDGVEADGGAAFDRSLFGVGVGFTALFVTIGDRIAVEFDLVARPERSGTPSPRSTP